MVLEKEVDDVKDLMKFLYPILDSQDGDCPKIEWMGLGHGSGIGEWMCQLQTESYGDLLYGTGSECLENLPCSSSDYNGCSVYLAGHKE